MIVRGLRFAVPWMVTANVLACSGADHPPANVVSDGDSGVDVGVDSTTADGSPSDVAGDTTTTKDGGGKDGGGTDGSTKDGAPDAIGTFDAPTFDAAAPPVCPTFYSISATSTLVAYPKSATGDLLAGLTWDELTMAWTTKDASGVVIHYADRASRTDAFGSGFTLSSRLGPFPEDQVAFTPDGLTMIVVSLDHKTINQLHRPSRGVEFDVETATSAPFGRISLGGEGSPARPVTDLVLARDGRSLFFTDLTVKTVDSPSVMVSALLPDGTWDAPKYVDAPQMWVAAGGLHRHPSGISTDGRSLFYYDEVDESTKVSGRHLASSDFTDFFDFNPVGKRAMPTEACDRVYLSVDPTDGADGGPGPLEIQYAKE